MSLPALRRPKTIVNHEKSNKSLPTNSYVMITLKGDRKLVVTADSYNGILSMGDKYKCVFCGILFDLKQAAKEIHVREANHLKTLAANPHVAEFSHNLIRELTDDSKYCTVCNVVVSNVRLTRHVRGEAHLHELERAETRAQAYTPHS